MNNSLRDYRKEIDSLIANGEYPLAVERCNAILAAFPKDFETYRLLGKALLEDGKTAEAADVFSRALAIRPDDFISNIGLSCVREEEGNLEAAIWHMERAFEMDSSVAAVQAELKRLFELRDGEAPQKIQLTKGALVRMYVRGGMYQQAINEILMKFTDLDERPDMQVLLAGLYEQTEQKEAAVDLSRRILEKLPYCYDANLILLKSGADSVAAEEAAVCRDRLVEIDPYFMHAQAPSFDSSAVPDEAVVLSAVSVASAGEGSPLPGWLSEEEVNPFGAPGQPVVASPGSEKQDSLSPEEVPSSQPAETAGPGITNQQEPEPSGNLPEWMSETGWKPESEHEKLIEEEPADSGAKDVLPADIPDWVKDMAPESSEALGSPSPDLATTDDLSTILFTDLESAAAGMMDDSIPAPEEEEKLPDLPETDHPSPPSQEETTAIPDWLQGFDPSQQKTEGIDSEKSIPEWLDTEVQATPDQAGPFNLEDLADITSDEISQAPIMEGSTVDSGNGFEKPEWLNETSVETDINSLFASSQVSESVQPESPDWLNNLRTGSSESQENGPDYLKTDEIAGVESENEAQNPLGDTQPILVNRPQETPILDVWANEQVEQKEEPEFPPEAKFVDEDLDVFFKELDQQEKKTGEFKNETLEELPFDFLELAQPAEMESPNRRDYAAQAGDLAATINNFQNLIMEGRNLPGIITDIKKMADENPSEPGIWLLLGDAYHKNKQIQAALDAYTRAEETLNK